MPNDDNDSESSDVQGKHVLCGQTVTLTDNGELAVHAALIGVDEYGHVQDIQQDDEPMHVGADTVVVPTPIGSSTQINGNDVTVLGDSVPE